jgi:tRNA nucleotidyltransferase (CCA-adding enzyme)
MDLTVKKVKMPLLPSVKKAIDTLEMNGYEAFVVGGCVRDFIMGKAPHDYDMATNALPVQVMDAFSDFTLIKSGIKHGTVGVVIEGEKIEITTFRIDGEYDDNRHPKSVQFSLLLEDDTKRRDFTVNALAYSEKNGVVDFHGGISDMEKKLIRAVGDPECRFDEDALRILRALRFSCTLGFDIEEKTKKAIKKQAQLLQNISAERICEELDKLLLGKNVAECISEFEDVLSYVMPQVFPLDCARLSALSSQFENCTQAYAVVFSALPQDEATRICEKLKFSNERKQTVLAFLKEKEFPKTKIEVRWLLNRLGEKKSIDYLSYKRCFGIDTVQARTWMNEILANGECYSLHTLALNGADIISLGVSSGEGVGQLLQKALSSVVNEKIPNDKQALLEYVKSLI